MSFLNDIWAHTDIAIPCTNKHKMTFGIPYAGGHLL